MPDEIKATENKIPAITITTPIVVMIAVTVFSKISFMFLLFIFPVKSGVKSPVL
jgi:hypothetical protein